MGSITPYESANGKCCRVRYRKPDRSQTDKHGFRSKREAELFLASVEVKAGPFEVFGSGSQGRGHDELGQVSARVIHS